MDAMPIEIFIAQSLGKPKVNALTAEWRIDPKKVEDIVAASLREIGIFQVPFGHEKIVLASIISHLKHSPEIVRMVKKAQRSHAMKAQSRHGG